MDDDHDVENDVWMWGVWTYMMILPFWSLLVADFNITIIMYCRWRAHISERSLRWSHHFRGIRFYIGTNDSARFYCE